MAFTIQDKDTGKYWVKDRWEPQPNYRTKSPDWGGNIWITISGIYSEEEIQSQYRKAQRSAKDPNNIIIVEVED